MSNWINGNLTGKLSVGQGERGKSLEYMWRGTELGIRQEGEEDYQFVNLVSGADGREIELQVNNGYIQWRYAGEETWNNLIELSALEGKQGPKGDKGEQGIPGKDGKDGVTPNITIGTVTTLEAGEEATVTREGTNENPIFNFGIPKGESGNSSGSNSVSIDDNTISTDKTWSSSKIEDFVLTNVGAIWKDVNGGQMVIDSTMDGFLREVEILGNTIQNQDDLSDIQHLGVWNEKKQGYEIEIVVSNSSNKDDLNYQEYRTTIILPCQLMKVGNISDRLYWDKNKNKYIIEKKVEYVLPQHLNIGKFETRINSNKIAIYNAIPFKYNDGQNFNNKTVQYLNYQSNDWGNKDTLGGVSTSWEGHIYLTPAIKYNTQEEAQAWLNTLLDIEIGFMRNQSRLIETNIIKEISLPCYKDKTHLFVNGGIQGSIKAKAPVDGGKVIGVLQEENIKLKATNEAQDELINTTMLATDEMYMMLEPLLAETLSERGVSKMVDMYVAMVQRGIKTIEQVPVRYREQVKKILDQLEK